MYSSTNVRGAAHKVGHLFLALTTHPHFGRWVALAELAALAAAAIALFLRTLLRSSKPSRWSPALSFGSMALLLCFGSSACNSPGGHTFGGMLGQSESALLSGDTTHGPAIGTYYYHPNHIQSTSVVTDATGNEVTRMAYLPFGEVSQANSTGANTVTAKFTGQDYDDSFGLYYYNARYYDPSIGRFMSADTVVPDAWNAQAYNRYSYALNNPINYVDPSGHMPWLAWVFSPILAPIIVVAAAVAIVATAALAAFGVMPNPLTASGRTEIANDLRNAASDFSNWLGNAGDTVSGWFRGGGGGGGSPGGGGGGTTIGVLGSPGAPWAQPSSPGGVFYMDQMSRWAGAQLAMDPRGCDLLRFLGSSRSSYTVGSEYGPLPWGVPRTTTGITGNVFGEETGYEHDNGLDIRLWPNNAFDLGVSGNVANLGHELSHAALWDAVRNHRESELPGFLQPFLQDLMPGMMPNNLSPGGHAVFGNILNWMWGEL